MASVLSTIQMEDADWKSNAIDVTLFIYFLIINIIYKYL